MVGTAASVMKKYISHPAKWVVKNKIKSMLGKPICTDSIPNCSVGQDPLQGDLRGGDSMISNIKASGLVKEMPDDERLKLIDEIELENE